MNGVARVVVDSPLPQLDRLFDYAIPDHLADEVAPGVRVRVPVRAQRRVMDGYVVEVTGESSFAGALSELDAVVSTVPVLAPEVWATVRRVADRAAGVASDVLRLAIPKRQARIEKAFLAEDATGGVAARSAGVSRPATAILSRYDPALPEAVLAGERIILRAIPEPGAWASVLVELAALVIAEGRSAIVVAPDQRDVDRLSAAAADAVPAERIVRFDAGQPAADRYRAFLRARSESGLLIIGSRAAAYAPAAELGLLAIWDDGDPSHRELHAPGVHARDVALLRQEVQDCALILAAHAPSTEAERLVEVGWCRRFVPNGRPPRVLPTALQTSADRLAEQARIPSSAWRAAREALETGPVLVQVSRPGEDVPVGSARTAAELGRAFPQARVVLADAAHPVERVGPEPGLVVATRGAEPFAVGGYRAVLLLDGERMLARESLRVAEDCVRTWTNAVALAAPGAQVFLVGVAGRLARRLAAWQLEELAAEELADRRAARLPPAVRTATIVGPPDVVDAAVAAAGIEGTDVIAPVRLDDGLLRTVVRFDYRRGVEVASAIRTEILRRASGRSGRRSTSLRVRFDDAEPFGAEPLRSPGRIER